MSVGVELGGPPVPVPNTLELGQRCGEDGQPHLLSNRTLSPDLQLDFSMMEQKKRVTQILQSPVFKDELEGLMQDQVSKGGTSSGLLALSHIADLIMGNTSPGTGVYGSSLGVGMVTPVNEVFGLDGSYSKAERQSRCKLASLYRLLELYGWTHCSNAYSTVRVCKEQDHVVILPQGLSFAEATVANLVKLNMLGDVVEQGSTGLDVDASGFSLHAAIYSTRPDAKCVIHIHTPATAAVSSMKCGILPISHEALLLGDVSYFSYHGDVDDGQERVELQKALGPTAKVLVLRNHGVLAFGESVEEAFHHVFHCQQACEVQVSALACAGAVENLLLLDRGCALPPQTPLLPASGEMQDGQMRWKVGEAEFESLMRMLDNLGYRTGYAYRHPIVREKPRHKNEVEIPATVTALGLDEQDAFPRSPLDLQMQRRERERARWLNSPNCYLRVNVPEPSANGQYSPRTRTMWMKSDESGSSSGTPIKIEDPNQFVPLNTNPTEVLEKRNRIREQNRADMMTAGPRSQLLAGIVIDTVPGPAYIYEDEEESASQPPNPFSLSDKDLQDYTSTVERHQHDADDVTDADEMTTYDSSTISLSLSPLMSPTRDDPLADLLPNGRDDLGEDEDELNLRVTELSISKEMEISITTTVAETIGDAASPESQPQSPKRREKEKKKKKFRTPSFLKMNKKKEKVEV